MGAQEVETVRQMWIDYRERGVEAALGLLDPEVVFRSFEGEVHTGRDGVRTFFARFGGEMTFAASPYTFEPCGAGVVVAGHRRIRYPDRMDSQYMYFSHHVRQGLVVRVAAWADRESATRDLLAPP